MVGDVTSGESSGRAGQADAEARVAGALDRIPAFKHLRRTLEPTWTTLALAAAVTLWTVHREWRTWTTGGRYEWSEHHFYWPWYTWSHTDFVIGPSAFLLTLDFLTGVALWYLPAAALAAGLRYGVATAPFRGGSRLGTVARAAAFRPRRGLGVLVFGVLASTFPPLPVSLFTFPGLILLLILHSPFNGTISEPSYITGVPLSYLVWYGLVGAVWRLRRYARGTGVVTDG